MKTSFCCLRICRRILNDEEIRALWSACDAMDGKNIFGAMVKVLLLTGQRRDKVATMKRMMSKVVSGRFQAKLVKNPMPVALFCRR